MKVARWGNGLAVRLPVEMVRRLGVTEGDEIEAEVVAPGKLSVCRSLDHDVAIAAIRSLAGKLPADYKFDREEANAR